jgi:hypothetical protein
VSLKELLPDGGMTEFISDDLITLFQSVRNSRLRHTLSAGVLGFTLIDSDAKRLAEFKGQMLNCVKKAASLDSDQPFWVILEGANVGVPLFGGKDVGRITVKHAL